MQLIEAMVARWLSDDGLSRAQVTEMLASALPGVLAGAANADPSLTPRP
jgi:hypothetical protein